MASYIDKLNITKIERVGLLFFLFCILIDLYRKNNRPDFFNLVY